MLLKADVDAQLKALKKAAEEIGEDRLFNMIDAMFLLREVLTPEENMYVRLLMSITPDSRVLNYISRLEVNE